MGFPANVIGLTPPLPPDFGTVVPEGGSSCASCRYLVGKSGVPHCDNTQFIAFRRSGRGGGLGGVERIPAPDDDPKRYCCNAWQQAAGVKLSASLLDLGPSDVHSPSAGGHFTPTRTPTMADISAQERKKLKPSQFADPTNRAYPIHDKSHADNAAARLEQQKGSMSAGKYASIKRRIKAAQKRFGEKPKTAAGSVAQSRGRGLRMAVTHPDGTHVEVRHMAAYSAQHDTLFLSFALDKAAALADGDENKRVWVQVAKTGHWRGHPSGPFTLNSAVFDALIRNFKSQTAGRVHYDFDHCSELSPTSGSRPAVGCPAQGWIYDLKHDGQALYALTEWGDLARQYIREDKYAGVSPAIHWKTKDRVSGTDIGPQITSVALTNDPFLHMNGTYDRLAASAQGDEGAEQSDLVGLTDAEETFAGAYAYASHEYMPRIKAALRLADGVNPIEAGEHYARFRSRLDDADGDMSAMHDGTPLGAYVRALRSVVNPSMGTTLDEMVDIVQDLIDDAIDEHNAIYHPDGPPEASAASATGTGDPEPTTEETTAMTTPTTDTNETKTLLAAAQTEVQTLTATVKSKDAEIDALKKDNATLASWKADREKKDTEARVVEAIDTWGQKRGLKNDEDTRGWMTTLCTNSPVEFEKAYPRVDASKRHLLQTFTNDGRQATQGGPAPRAQTDAPVPPVDLPEMNLRTLSRKIAREDGLPIEVAQERAERMLASARVKSGK